MADERREREARRERIRADQLAKAEREARALSRSLKCAGGAAAVGFYTPRHAGEFGGCLNDGSTCLCECHDPEEP